MYVRVVIEGAVHGAEKIRSLEPPVTEQLGVERRHDDGASAGTVALRLVSRDSIEQVDKVFAVVARPPPSRRRVVRLLVAEVDVIPRHTPELESARPADFVELEVRPVSRVPAVTTPDLCGGDGVAH